MKESVCKIDDAGFESQDGLYSSLGDPDCGFLNCVAGFNSLASYHDPVVEQMRHAFPKRANAGAIPVGITLVIVVDFTPPHVERDPGFRILESRFKSGRRYQLVGVVQWSKMSLFHSEDAGSIPVADTISARSRHDEDTFFDRAPKKVTVPFMFFDRAPKKVNVPFTFFADVAQPW